MVTPNSNVDSTRDEEVQQPDDRYLRKDKVPAGNFREIADRVDEKRFQEEDDEAVGGAKKKSDNKPVVKKSSSSSNQKKVDPQAQAVSLFDLARGVKDSTEEEGEEQASSQQLSAQGKPKLKPKLKPDTTKPFDLMSKLKQSEAESDSQQKDDSQFMREQSDLSAVNPMTQAAPFAISSALKSSETSTANKSMQEVIDEIQKAAYTLELNGKTETVIQLKGALFNDANLTLTEFNSARGEFNITFDNLTQAAKNVIDMNQHTLLDDLSKKGYVVHIFTATTAPLQVVQTDQGQPSSDQKRDEQQGQQGGQKKQQQDDTT